VITAHCFCKCGVGETWELLLHCCVNFVLLLSSRKAQHHTLLQGCTVTVCAADDVQCRVIAAVRRATPHHKLHVLLPQLNEFHVLLIELALQANHLQHSTHQHSTPQSLVDACGVPEVPETFTIACTGVSAVCWNCHAWQLWACLLWSPAVSTDQQLTFTHHIQGHAEPCRSVDAGRLTSSCLPADSSALAGTLKADSASILLTAA
jgi:hypothetical protein